MRSIMQVKSDSQSAVVPKNVQVNEVEQPKLSAYEQGKKAQNLAVLNAAANANSNSAANNPMQLLYKTAIEEINKHLEPTLGENAAQSAYDSDLDVSPKATADRIIQGSTAFYEAFKLQNTDLTDEESLDKFLSVIGSGIDTGFEEAKGILDSLKVLEGDIATNIDTTYDFVQEGLNSFKELILAKLTANQAENDVDKDIEK